MLNIIGFIIAVLSIPLAIFSTPIFEKIKPYLIKVKRLNINNDRELEDFFDLFSEKFPEEEGNDNPGHLIQSLEEDEKRLRHVQCDEIYLVAKYNSRVIGFIACYYYPSAEYGIVGYMARSKEENAISQYGSKRLIKKLKRILPKECKSLLYETLGRQSLMKARLFSNLARNMNLISYQFDIDILKPRLNLDDTIDVLLKLFIVPLKDQLSGETISKSKFLEILDFLLFCCYGDYYKITDSNHIIYHNYLKERYNNYIKILPDFIPIKRLNEPKLSWWQRFRASFGKNFKKMTLYFHRKLPEGGQFD
jgi:hypothetical protein